MAKLFTEKSSNSQFALAELDKSKIIERYKGSLKNVYRNYHNPPRNIYNQWKAIDIMLPSFTNWLLTGKHLPLFEFAHLDLTNEGTNTQHGNYSFDKTLSWNLSQAVKELFPYTEAQEKCRTDHIVSHHLILSLSNHTILLKLTWDRPATTNNISVEAFVFDQVIQTPEFNLSEFTKTCDSLTSD